MKFGIIFEQEELYKNFISSANNTKSYNDYNTEIKCFSYNTHDVFCAYAKSSTTSFAVATNIMLKDLDAKMIILVGFTNSINSFTKVQDVVVSQTIIALSNNTIIYPNQKPSFLVYKVSEKVKNGLFNGLKIGRMQPRTLFGTVISGGNITDLGLIDYLSKTEDALIVDGNAFELARIASNYKADFVSIKGICEKFLNLDNKYNDLNSHYCIANTLFVLNAFLNSISFK